MLILGTKGTNDASAGELQAQEVEVLGASDPAVSREWSRRLNISDAVSDISHPEQISDIGKPAEHLALTVSHTPQLNHAALAVRRNRPPHEVLLH